MQHGATIPEAKSVPKNEHDMRMTPDPCALVMPALAAVGAIASIAAINWVAQDSPIERPRGKRKANVALRDLENACMGLQDVFARLIKHPRLVACDGAGATSPMKFGINGSRTDADTARMYQQIASDIASKLVLACSASYDAMSAIEDGEIEAPEELFYGFGEQQERLNKLVAERAPLKTAIAVGYDVAGKLSGLVRELKQFRVA